MAKVNGKKLNRRVAFRIYEQANLFYRKLDHDGQLQAPENFDDLLSNVNPPDTVSPLTLPDSQSRENDTLNVNISASGIAFTSKDALQAGDYLLLRILLLSSMTAIMTCCKVVYCKPSNPYENDRYPYLIGAQFVNLTSEDTALLNKHIDRTKKQQWATNGLLLSLALLALAMPDTAFGLLMGLIHHVFEVVLHVVHLMFEYAEYNLDHVIEHAFHTDTHTTQVIVFYILCTVGLIGLYFLWRIVPRNCRRAGNSLIAFWCRKKASCLYYWGEQSLADKIKFVGLTLVAVGCYGYFAI
ncbi:MULTISPECIES: PilZ domain-containing protein [Methylomonas]|nr:MULTISPECIES: PilZ domain-containing protein [Methylomonas]